MKSAKKGGENRWENQETTAPGGIAERKAEPQQAVKAKALAACQVKPEILPGIGERTRRPDGKNKG